MGRMPRRNGNVLRLREFALVSQVTLAINRPLVATSGQLVREPSARFSGFGGQAAQTKKQAALRQPFFETGFYRFFS